MWTLLGVLIASLYIGAPILIYFRQRSPSADDAVRLRVGDDDAELMPEARSYLTRAEAVLQREGFGQATSLTWRGTARMESYLSVLEHQDPSTIAVPMAVQVKASGKTVVRCVLNLRSDFQDGRSMFTSNLKTGRTFPRVPTHDSVRLPNVSDPVALWHIHRRRVEQRARAVPTVQPTRDGDGLDYARREIEESHQRWIGIGYYRRTPNGGVRPTLRGAALMVWRLLFPWKQINDVRDGARLTA